MDFKLPDEHAVILAQTLVTVWQSDNALDGHEIRRSLLLDTVITARPHVTAQEWAAAGARDSKRAHHFLPMFGRGGPENDDVACDYDDEKGHDLIQKAMDGDTDADAVLCGIAARFVLARREMPTHLHQYTFFVLMNRRDMPPSRPKRHAKIGRNVSIVFAVGALQNFGFHPTRNRATFAQRSGCSIVAEALSKMGFPINEAGVEEVWGDRAHFAVKDFTVRD